MAFLLHISFQSYSLELGKTLDCYVFFLAQHLGSFWLGQLLVFVFGEKNKQTKIKTKSPNINYVHWQQQYCFVTLQFLCPYPRQILFHYFCFLPNIPVVSLFVVAFSFLHQSWWHLWNHGYFKVQGFIHFSLSNLCFFSNTEYFIRWWFPVMFLKRIYCHFCKLPTSQWGTLTCVFSVIGQIHDDARKVEEALRNKAAHVRQTYSNPSWNSLHEVPEVWV